MIQKYKSPWTIKYCGRTYQIRYDITREYNEPKWYVIDITNLRVSHRFYSWPEGAFTALRTGSLSWT